MEPRIEPVPPGITRPIWSVMIPTYNCARLLATTLGSVLAQDYGPDVMQIEVIDDCSTRDDPESIVREMGAGRVGFYRQPKNVGSTQNFNTCLNRSTGLLVHILHGDDWVLPGFYDRVELSVRRYPEIVFFCVRAFLVDEAGGLNMLSPRVPTLELPDNDVTPFMYSNPFFTPSVVVRRAFYEATGGYMPELTHAADWEMWIRAISRGGACAINQPLVCYRQFANNETGRYARTAENVRDFVRLREIFSIRYRGFNPSIFTQMILAVATSQAENFRRLNDFEAALANEYIAQELARTL
jgi:glycosyltransferase involved in cell wall biosynthesis